jgi:hypothetical protein
MMRILMLLLLLLQATDSFAQTFEAQWGGFHFFAPTKVGYVGMSTISFNIGIGQYVSSGNTVTTYYSDGSVKNSASVDCRDGLTAGFANEENDFSYLLTYFVNTYNSVYKLVLYQVDTEGDLDRVSINLKAHCNTFIGRGDYVLDLKYAVATNNAFVFVFSKYENNTETFYAGQVLNESDEVRFFKLQLSVNDQDVYFQKTGIPKFTSNGSNILTATQWQLNKGQYRATVLNYSLEKLSLDNEQEYLLDFIGKTLFPCPSLESNPPKTYESNFSSVIARSEPLKLNLFQFEYDGDQLILSGLYYDKRSKMILELKADGLYYLALANNQKTITAPEQTVEFSYAQSEDKTPSYLCLFGSSQFYCSLLYKREKKLYVTDSENTFVNIDLKNAHPGHALIYSMDEEHTVDTKYLKSKRSKLYRASKSIFCVYGIKANTTGLLTKLMVQKFSI